MRNKGWRRGWLGAVLGLIVLLATTCTPPAAPSPSPLPPSPTPPLPTPTPSPMPGPPIAPLTLWLPEDLNPYGDGPGADLLARHLAEFQATHPDIQVQVIVKKSRGRGGLLDFLRTARAAAPSVLPDLIVLDEADLQVAAQAGLIQPLDALLPDGWSTDLFPFATDLGRVGDQTFGLALTAELEHLAYTPDLLEAPPLSWNDVLSATVPLFFPAAGQNESASDFTLIQYLGAGGRLVDAEGKPAIEEEPLAAVLDFYAQATATGVISPLLVLSLGDAEACWARLQAEGGIAVVNSRRFWTEGDGKAEPAPIPTRDGRPIALAEGWVIALVTANPEAQQRAMALATGLLEPGWYGAWTQATGYLPVTRSGLASWNIPRARQETVGAILEGARGPIPAALRSRVGPPIQAAVEAVLQGRRGPREAAALAAQAVP